MVSGDISDEVLDRYLLGDLGEAEGARIGESLFSDDDLFDRLLAAETDLIDRYARGEMAAGQRELFENTALSRESMLQRIRFARALSAGIAGRQSGVPREALNVAPGQSRHPRRVWYGLAAAVALAALGASVLVIRHSRQSTEQASQSEAAAQQSVPSPSAEPAQTDNTQASRSPEPRPAGSNEQKPGRQPPGTVATFVLLPGSTRDGSESQTLTIESGVRSAKLHFQLGESDEYPSYGAILRTTRGTHLLRRSGLTAGRFGFGRAVTIELSTRGLPAGQYELELTGQPEGGPAVTVNYYYFAVVHQ